MTYIPTVDTCNIFLNFASTWGQYQNCRKCELAAMYLVLIKFHECYANKEYLSETSALTRVTAHLTAHYSEQRKITLVI